MLGRDGKPYRCGGATIRRLPPASATPKRVDRRADKPWAFTEAKPEWEGLFLRLRELGKAKRRRTGCPCRIQKIKLFSPPTDTRPIVWKSDGFERRELCR